MTLMLGRNRGWMGGLVDNVQIYQDSNGCYLLSGELSYSNVSQVYKKTANLFRKQKSNIEIDLSGVTHADSAGIALLVEWLSEARESNKAIHFVNVPQQMLEMVRISSLDRVLPIS